MSTDRRWAGRAFVVVGFVSTLFAACAKGNQETTTSTEGAGGAPDPTTTTSGGETGGGGSALPMGATGSPCSTDTECTSGHCTQVGTKKYCTAECPPDCPKGTYCFDRQRGLALHPRPRPAVRRLQVGRRLLDAHRQVPGRAAGRLFCARDRTTIGLAPTASRASTATRTWASGPARAAAWTGRARRRRRRGRRGERRGRRRTKPRWRPSGACPTAACRALATRGATACSACVQQRQQLRASALATSRATARAPSGRAAPPRRPWPSACNGKDDNCNTQVDEGDPNALCVANGPPPSHSAWTCKLGTCALGACDAGWASYPAGPVANGCTCPVEAGEPNGSCATAKDAGTVSDAGGSVMLQGTLSSDNDVDFWKFNTVDTDQFTTNSYHVSIDFTTPTPNTEFVMDVIRGSACSEIPRARAPRWSPTTGASTGRRPASARRPAASSTAPLHCNNYSSNYYVRVHRKPGATGSCTSYTIKATATGGDACDFSTQCQ